MQCAGGYAKEAIYIPVNGRQSSPVNLGASFHASDIKTCMIMLSIAFRVAVETHNRKSKQIGSMC